MCFLQNGLLCINRLKTADTSFLQRENLLTPAGLCGQACKELGGFHRTSVSVIGRSELQRCGGRQRLTSSAETQWRWSSDYMSHHALGLSGGRWAELLVQEVFSNNVNSVHLQDILQCLKPILIYYIQQLNENENKYSGSLDNSLKQHLNMSGS